ncbi:MAG: hypothetical protein JHC85_15450, partial [Chthoniobacterales bacterium]|nr:hypothetical protein [Chthoniobacterales bacterium]
MRPPDKFASAPGLASGPASIHTASSMGVEIERKFLVADDSWRGLAAASHPLRQGYLAVDGGITLRVRTD